MSITKITVSFLIAFACAAPLPAHEQGQLNPFQNPDDALPAAVYVHGPDLDDDVPSLAQLFSEPDDEQEDTQEGLGYTYLTVGFAGEVYAEHPAGGARHYLAALPWDFITSDLFQQYQDVLNKTYRVATIQ